MAKRFDPAIVNGEVYNAVSLLYEFRLNRRVADKEFVKDLCGSLEMLLCVLSESNQDVQDIMKIYMRDT